MQSNRGKTLLLTIYVCFLATLGRFFYWQIIKGGELKDKALGQVHKLSKENAQRGSIFYNDKYPIVVNRQSLEVAIYKPNLKLEPKDFLEKIEELSPGLSKQSQLTNFFIDENLKWIKLSETFPLDKKKQLEDMGLEVVVGSDRYYPDESVPKSIVGIIGKSDSGLVGIGGMEAYYERQLHGKPGYLWTARDAEGNRVLTHRGWKVPATNGRDLVTTLDRSVQYEVTSELKKGVDQFLADSGSAVVMDPSTGKILAMSVAMSDEEATKSGTKNIIISNLFEPGSIFKPLVMTAALDSGAIKEDFICDKCDRGHTIGEYTIGNWDDSVHPNSTLYDIIKNSDNIGMSWIIDALGQKRFLDYYEKLGFQRKTGIDLQGESLPLVKKYWPEIDLATASFGQGLAINQMQMIQAFNTLANKGVLVSPQIGEELLENDKKIKIKSKEGYKVFSESATNKMVDILKFSVENGVVSNFKPKGLEACAKSGTAQIAVGGGYTDDETIASYIGFSPCVNPKFTMIITINKPRSSPWGSSTAAPIWFNLAEKLNRLL